jgi:hypothetical protein
MARGDDPASASTSFFIVTGDGSSLDGKYTAFGRVLDGMAAVEALEATPVNGETPVTRIELKSVRISKVPGLWQPAEKVRPEWKMENGKWQSPQTSGVFPSSIYHFPLQDAFFSILRGGRLNKP